ncbi:ABC transporter substrate-binding protein [Brucella pseudogrignonensis]|uniref:ABC transporter substrate-binding protein n=1 Tax=Brucella pseudogrignonensis TaxID=419475 RepID=UPI0038D05A4A
MRFSNCKAAFLAAATMTVAGGASAQDLQYWVYSDFAQGDALKLQQEFIAEFEKANPGVKITISGRGDDDLTSGQIAGAASGSLPDVYMNGLAVGAQLVDVKALANIYSDWMAMPQEFRDQFNPEAIKSCSPAPETMYCLPYTGFGEIVYRNLTVLEKAGIDTSVPPATWEEWLAQMQKVKQAGSYAIPDMTQVFNGVVAFYAIVGDKKNWTVDFTTNKTAIDKESLSRTLQTFVDMAKLNSGTSRNDQATRDLFITNQLAFHTSGPWLNPTYAKAAAESGLKYDFVLLPGRTAGDHGGVRSYEFVGVAPGSNREIAWKFAAFITEKTQMARWAKLLSRYNANAAAMADPEVDALPLVKTSVEAVRYAMDVQPPYFVKPIPNCYRQAITDMASAVADEEYTPDEGAEELIDELNACLAEK